MQNDVFIIYLPPESEQWPGLLAQFILEVAARDGRHFAAWAGERFSRMTAREHGLVALEDGRILGVVFFEVTDRTIDLTFPWLARPDRDLAGDLMLAALRVIQDKWPAVRDVRVERQLLPENPDTTAVTDAGFECHRRKRMSLELNTWSELPRAPAGYRFAPWNIRELDAAAEIVHAANRETLDARLYASFFGNSPRDCRHGLLSILAGKYGPIHPRATLCAFRRMELIGLNLIISNSSTQASIIEISVAPAHQQKGLGRALIAGSLRVLKEDRCELVELAVTESNLSAIRLYESLGFSEVGQFAVCVLPAA